MIDTRDILADFRDQLARQIGRRDQSPPFEPLTTTPWIASSLLQKAIRRGRSDLALRAAATLLVNASDRFWRRCGGIAFEDIGVANPEVVGLVIAALAGKRMRASLGGEWSVASMIVSAMAAARKCRAADDLLMSVELHPAHAEARKAQAALSINQLRRIVLSSTSLHERALALWYMSGTERRPPGI
jgi:replication-associated recombination protein RarA